MLHIQLKMLCHSVGRGSVNKVSIVQLDETAYKNCNYWLWYLKYISNFIQEPLKCNNVVNRLGFRHKKVINNY